MAKITEALIGQDKSEELKNECAAHLDTLFGLGKSKSEYYAEKIQTSLLGAGQGTDRTFPITTIQSFIYDTRAYTSDNANNITEVINGAIDGFVDGDNKGASQKLISGFVNTLFGASSGSESEVIRYFAVLEGVSMVRLDFAGWAKVVKSQALKSKCDKVSAFVLYRSIVDMKKVSLNDFTAVYQHTVKAEHPDYNTKQILQECHELYQAFNPSGNSSRKLQVNRTMHAFEPKKGHHSLDVFKEDIKSL